MIILKNVLQSLSIEKKGTYDSCLRCMKSGGSNGLYLLSLHGSNQDEKGLFCSLVCQRSYDYDPINEHT